ncbi:hypothetical protein ABPG75_013942 [Micractinium tetrahymenae]
MQAALGSPALGPASVSRLKTCRPGRRLVARSALRQEPAEPEGADGQKPAAWKGALLGAALAPLVAANPGHALEAAALEPLPPADLPAYPASVRQLLRELRTQTDALQRAQWELEATQRLLYTSQEQLLQKQRQVEEMRQAQPSLFTAIAASGAAAAGALGGLRAYLDAGMRKIELERKRTDAVMEAEVKGRLTEEVEAEIERRIADERAREAATILGIVQAEQAARAEAEGRAEVLQQRTEELQQSLEQVSASLAAVREAKQAAETQMALARIEAEAKARAADEMRKAQEEAATTQRNDFMSVMQQLLAEQSRTTQLQRQLEEAGAVAHQAQQASASAEAALQQLAIEQERSGELAARVQELVASQEAAAARFREAQEELDLERTRNSSLKERLEAAKALAEQQPAQDAAAAEQLREANQRYLETLEQLHAERGHVANLQMELASKQSELQRISADVALLRRRSAAELDRLRTTLAATGLVPPLQHLTQAAPGGRGQQPDQAPRQQQEDQQAQQAPLNGHSPAGLQQLEQQPEQQQDEAPAWAPGPNGLPDGLPQLSELEQHREGQAQLNGAMPAEINGQHADEVALEQQYGDALAADEQRQLNGNGLSEQAAAAAQQGAEETNGHGPAAAEQAVAAGAEEGEAQQRWRFGLEQEPREHPAWVQETAAAIPESQSRAAVREWTDPAFTCEVLNAFPAKAVADVEEARCLIERGGYAMLDVRPELELDVVGRVRGCTNIPLEHSRWVYNSEARSKEVERRPNKGFVEEVERRFPSKNTPLLVGCSDGKAYSIEALTVLEDAGYTRLVGLMGGFHAWFTVFDSKGRRRRSGGGQLART